jgi:hypothetical protein
MMTIISKQVRKGLAPKARLAITPALRWYAGCHEQPRVGQPDFGGTNRPDEGPPGQL